VSGPEKPAGDPAERRLRRQLAQLEECFEQVVTSVGKGKPLDLRMSEIFAGKRELGSRDRRLMKETIYSYFRWKGWIDQIATTPQKTLAIAGFLAFTEPPPALELLAKDQRLRLSPVDAGCLSDVKQ